MKTFTEKAMIRHNNTYNYDLVEYKNSISKVQIICPTHGIFTQAPAEHLRGKGCPACGNVKKLTTNEFIEKALVVHKNKYTYDKVLYKNNRTSVIITCPEHGDFLQTPNRHISQKQGCPKCAKAQKHYNQWSYSNWEKSGQNSKHFKAFTLYVIECWNDTEQFIKVGKTYTAIQKRFDSKRLMPYNWKIVYEKFGSAEYISTLEQKIHAECKYAKYIPKFAFGGIQECLNIEIKSKLKDFL